MTAQRKFFPQNSPGNRIAADAELEWLLCLASTLQATQRPQDTQHLQSTQYLQPREIRQGSEASGAQQATSFNSTGLETEQRIYPPMWREMFMRLRLLPRPAFRAKKRDAA